MDDNEEFFDKLIEAVREEKVIYSKTHPAYYNKQVKVNAWKKISAKIGKPQEVCEKRWGLLREKFARELKKRDAPSGSAALHGPTWPYFESMSFLKSYIKTRRTISNNEDIPETYEESSEAVLPTDDVFSPSSSITTSETSTKKRRKESEEELTTELKNLIKTYKNKIDENEETEDEMFMKSMANMMKDLPESAKIRIKKLIFNTII